MLEQVLLGPGGEAGPDATTLVVGVDHDVEHADIGVGLEPQPHRQRPPDQLTRDVDGELELDGTFRRILDHQPHPLRGDDPLREVPGPDPGGGRDVCFRGHADRMGNGHA